MNARTCLAIVLAAGEGTRMRSALPKVLHQVAGRTLLTHVLAAVADAGVSSTAVVIGPGQDAVAKEVIRGAPDAVCFVQQERRGTAHAVLAARPAIERQPDDILVVYGDTPLMRAAHSIKLPHHFPFLGWRSVLGWRRVLDLQGLLPALPKGLREARTLP